MKIVYCSKTGHTQKYAEMLAKSLKIKSISIDKYKNDDDKVIFMGWVSAGKINGYNKINKSNIVCTIAVGLSPNMKDNNNNLINRNKISEKFFYLQGGLDYSKTKGLMKFIYTTVGKIAIKNCNEKDKELYTIFINGGNFIKEDNLKDIIKFINTI